MGLRVLWVFLFLLACQEKIVQTKTSSSRASYCDPSVASLQNGQASTFSVSTAQPLAIVGKVKLDSGTISEPKEENGFLRLLPNNLVKRNQGFRQFSIGENQLVAVIDHECTLGQGVNSLSKIRKQNLNISESLMTREDDQLQDPRKKIRRSSRAFLVSPKMTLDELAQLAESDPCVVVVGNNAVLRSFAPNDAHYAAGLNQKTAYLDSINFATAYEKFYGVAGTIQIAQNVNIAIIDSGVHITHEDLDNNLWTNDDAADGVDNDGNGKIDDVNGWNFATDIASPEPETWVGYGGSEGHGTHVAGIAAAEGNNAVGVVGIIEGHGKIMALNVFGDSPGAYTTNLDNAITYAVNEGAHVINMSLGGETYAASTLTAIQAAVVADVVVVAAAGNGDDNGYGLVLNSSYNVYPAGHAKDINGMISVGSFDALTGDRSVFSNCSSTYVEISAPGAYDSTAAVTGGIPSTWHTSNSAYVKSNGGYAIYGTSMASPVVAGAAALAISLYATDSGGTFPSASAVETYLESSASTVSALSSYVKYGKALDLNALYDYVDALQ